MALLCPLPCWLKIQASGGCAFVGAGGLGKLSVVTTSLSAGKPKPLSGGPGEKIRE